MRRFDALAHARFAAAGIADNGLYLAPNAPEGTVPTPCRVTVDRNMQTVGGLRQYSAGFTEVDYWLADVAPVRNGVLTVDGEVWINDDQVSNDGSLSRWRVRRG